jgi:hypothetical protein
VVVRRREWAKFGLTAYCGGVALLEPPTPFESTTLTILVIATLIASLVTILFAWRNRRK